MRREDDDLIEPSEAGRSGYRGDTIMEIMNDGGDDIVDLYNASASGSTTILNNLINKDPHILHKISLTPFSETPLHISALLGHLDFTKTLLAQNPCLASELDYYKRSPLHLASAKGHIEIVQALLHAYEGACLIPDQDGKIPLHYAAMRGRVDVMKKLIVVRPDSTRVLVSGKETVLHLCVKYNQLEPLKLLVESTSEDGHFLNSKNSEGGITILHLAVTLKQIEASFHLFLEYTWKLNYVKFILPASIGQ